jgi:hypothetical protein
MTSQAHLRWAYNESELELLALIAPNKKGSHLTKIYMQWLRWQAPSTPTTLSGQQPP